jgi:hypothetical protein
MPLVQEGTGKMDTPPRVKARMQGRAPVVMNAKLRIIGGKSIDVYVTDLTAEGCCIVAPKSELRIHQEVSIKLESLDFIKGRIGWSNENAAGIEFERPLYGPVVEHLQRIYR